MSKQPCIGTFFFLTIKLQLSTLLLAANYISDNLQAAGLNSLATSWTEGLRSITRQKGSDGLLKALGMGMVRGNVRGSLECRTRET